MKRKLERTEENPMPKAEKMGRTGVQPIFLFIYVNRFSRTFPCDPGAMLPKIIEMIPDSYMKSSRLKIILPDSHTGI